MRKYLGTLVVLLILMSPTAKASSAGGGELRYDWLHDSTYKVSFLLYHDCFGGFVRQALPLCISNPCANPLSYSADSLRLETSPSNGAVVENGCFSKSSYCNGGFYNAYRKYIYSTTVTLSSTCTNWEFSTTVRQRSTNNNFVYTAPQTENPYYSATLNNSLPNSSPIITAAEDFYNCQGWIYRFHPQTTDPDGDSLTFERTTPQYYTGIFCSNQQTAIPLPFLGTNTAEEPLNSRNVTFNPANGNWDFVTLQTGASLIALKINKYRNGVLMGSITREFTINMVHCGLSNIVKHFDGSRLAGGVLINDTVLAAANTPLSICFSAKDSFSNYQLVGTDNHVEIPGSSITYSGLGTDSISGCFSWTPTTADIGFHNLRITIKDSLCNNFRPEVPTIFDLPILVGPFPLHSRLIQKGNIDVVIYPNPAKQQINIASNLKTLSELIAMDGRKIVSATTSKSIFVSTLPPGIYLLLVRDAHNHTLLKRELITIAR